VTRFRGWGRIASAVAIAIGAVVVIGSLVASLTGLPSPQQLHPWLAPMKFNTALTLVLLGGALWLTSGDPPACAAGARRARLLAFAALAIGGATLAEYGFGIDLGIDELMARDSMPDQLPGRIAPMTASCVVVLGIALAWIETWWAEWLALTVALAAHIALLGHLYGVHDVYSIAEFPSVTLFTAIALYAVALGTVIARPQRGLMRFVANPSPGGVLARRLLPSAVVLPAVLALLRQWGERAGLYGTGSGRALLVASTSALFLVLIWRTAAALACADALRRLAEDEVREREAYLALSNARLRVLAEVSSKFAAVATSTNELLDHITRVMTELVGDGCTITLISDDGEQLVNAAHAHRDPALELAYRTYFLHREVPKATSQTVSAIVARTGEPRRADVIPEQIVEQTDEGLRSIVARLNVHSFAVVPIRVHQLIIGTLSLLRSQPARGYTDEDVTLLQDLADRAGLAIDNARLYEQLEQRVRERTSELEAANKELEAFSYSVAHDLRTPLRGIAGFSRTVIEDHAERLDSTGVQHLNRIEAAAQRMGHLIDDLLDLSRASRAAVNRTRVDMSEMAQAIFDQLRGGQPDRSVEVVIARELVAFADTRLVEIILTNLLGNAWKFTSKLERAHIEFAICDGRGPTTYVIRDNGAGFSPEYAGKLFGVFERLHTSREFEGTGIGLAIAQRIVHRHGGKIWAEGAVDRGASFFFTLEPTRLGRTVPPSLE
jgi:signal transduction histidine kinase